MIEITYDQLNAWLVIFFWPFCRLSGFIMACPVFGHSSVPTRAKIGLAAVLAVVAGPLINNPVNLPVASWAGLLIIVTEIAIGIAIGMVMKMTLASIQAAGEMISMQMGLSMAMVYAPDTGSQSSVLGRFLYMGALLMFLALNAHLVLIQIIVESFRALPPGSALDLDLGKALALHAATIFASGLLLSLPVVITLLIINLAMGILNRTAQQLSVFSIGFPVTLGAGLLLLTVLLMNYDRFLADIFQQGFVFTNQIIDSLAPTPQ